MEQGQAKEKEGAPTPVPAHRIGEILIEEGVLTEAALDRALDLQRASRPHIKLGTILLQRDPLAEESLVQALARHYRVEAAPWSTLSATPIEVTRLLPPAMAVRFEAFPYAATKTSIHIAFVHPSNLAAQDEIAALVSRRVIPAVALEIRLLQAHQRFYGRHIPQEYRSIVHKIEHRKTKPNPPDWQQKIEARGPDLAEAGQDAESVLPLPSPGVGTPSAELGGLPSADRPTPPSGTRIPTRRGPTGATDLSRDDMPMISVPEMPMPAPPGAAASSGGTSSFAKATEDKSPTAANGARLTKGADPHETRPRGDSAQPAPQDFVTEMWRPAAELGSGEDSSISRMWTPPAAESEPAGSPERSREEISQVALETFLGGVPRVLLLGCGKASISGWRGRGGDMTPEVVAAIRIPVSQSNVFASVRASGVPHFGPLERGQWPRALADALGQKAPDCAVFPIRLLDSIAGFLYADRLGEPMQTEDFAALARAAAATASALSRFLLRRSNQQTAG